MMVAGSGEGAMAATHYIIRGGLEGRERLRTLARVVWPTTHALLMEIGFPSDARCLDLGCGGGDVTVALARMVPDGFVVGVDIDETVIQTARQEAASAGITNVDFRVLDVTEPAIELAGYDVMYVRFLLTHLADPGMALAAMRDWVNPGGQLVVEDIDFSGHFCFPHSDAFQRYLELYSKVAEAWGCDPNIGPRLPSLVREAGFVAEHMHVVQPAGFSGDVKLLAPITLEAIADAVLAEGVATVEELDRLVDVLYADAKEDGPVQSLPRIVQLWARRPGG